MVVAIHEPTKVWKLDWAWKWLGWAYPRRFVKYPHRKYVQVYKIQPSYYYLNNQNYHTVILITPRFSGWKKSFSFLLFSLHARRKKVIFHLGKTFFYESKSCFYQADFSCVCSLKTNPVFLLLNPFLFMSSVSTLVLMLGVYL